MICILALVVFGIMGIFSASHRILAKEALDCVFRMVTLRPCNSTFDQRMKGKIVGKLINKSPKAAGFVNKNFKLLSTLMVIIFFISTIYSGIAIYNIGIHGTCTPENPDQCVFTPDQPVDNNCGECGIVGCELDHNDCNGGECTCEGPTCAN
jgi:hypothetical protein